MSIAETLGQHSCVPRVSRRWVWEDNNYHRLPPFFSEINRRQSLFELFQINYL